MDDRDAVLDDLVSATVAAARAEAVAVSAQMHKSALLRRALELGATDADMDDVTSRAMETIISDAEAQR